MRDVKGLLRSSVRVSRVMKLYMRILKFSRKKQSFIDRRFNKVHLT